MKNKNLIFILYFAFFLFSSVYVYASLTDGLLAYYSFDDGTGTDVSGNGRDANLNGVSVVDTAILGKGLYFDGVNYVILPDYTAWTDIKQNYTISLWYKMSSLPSSSATYPYYELLDLDESASVIYDRNTGISITIKPDGSITHYTGEGYYDPSDKIIIVSPTNVAKADNQWHNIVITRAGTNRRIYHDGVLVANGSYDFGYDVLWNNGPYSYGTCSLGTRYDPNIGLRGIYNGYMDEVLIYNITLSDAEISQLYNNGNGYNPYANTGILNLDFYNYTPLNNTIVGNNPIVLKFHVESNNLTNVSLYVNETLYQTLTGLSNGTYEFNYNVPDNEEHNYNFTLVVNGYNGLNETQTKIVYVDRVNPVINFGNEVLNGFPLEDNSTIVNDSFNFIAEATNHKLGNVEWYLFNSSGIEVYSNGVSVAVPDYIINDTLLSQYFSYGYNYIKVNATDSVNLTTTRSIKFFFDNKSPELTNYEVSVNNKVPTITIYFNEHSPFNVQFNDSRFNNIYTNSLGNDDYKAFSTSNESFDIGNYSILVTISDQFGKQTTQIINFEITEEQITISGKLGLKDAISEAGYGLGEFFSGSFNVGKLLISLSFISIVILLIGFIYFIFTKLIKLGFL